MEVKPREIVVTIEGMPSVALRAVYSEIAWGWVWVAELIVPADATHPARREALSAEPLPGSAPTPYDSLAAGVRWLSKSAEDGVFRIRSAP